MLSRYYEVMAGPPSRNFGGLPLSDTKDLCTADRARALSGWSAVLQSDALRITYLSLRPALEAICIHKAKPPSLNIEKPYTVSGVLVKPLR